MTGKPELYEQIATSYRAHRKPDARIQSAIDEVLGDAVTVVNVGAGAGSYEPRDRAVIAVEPALAMLRQRDPAAAPAVQATAQQLPFKDKSFDASLAILTLHHWEDLYAGLEELQRVSRERVVILTWDPEHDGFWLVRDYFSDILELDRTIFPTLEELSQVFQDLSVLPLPIPHDCSDGFLGAYWRRPELYLEESVRAAISSFSRIDDVEPRIERLRQDLASGEWLRKNAELAELDALDIGYRLIVADPNV